MVTMGIVPSNMSIFSGEGGGGGGGGCMGRGKP